MEATEEEGEDDFISFPEQPDGDGDGVYDEELSPFLLASASDLFFSSPSAASSSISSRAESELQGFWLYPPVSEYEEIPSLRWLSPPHSRPPRRRGSSSSPSAGSAGDYSWVGQRLPRDVKDVLSRAVVPVRYSSSEDLYVRLCSSILIDNGNKYFALDRSTGKKCYLLSASELRITWADEVGSCFRWTCVPHSRFSRVARLATVWWSAIYAEIAAEALSPGTTYVSFLVFGYSGRAFGQGLNSEVQEATVAIGARTLSRSSVFLQPNEQQRRRAGGKVPRRRSDGWLELEVGQFTTAAATKEEDEGMVRVSLERREIRYDDESIVALVVEGVEVRPRPPPPKRRGLGLGLLMGNRPAPPPPPLAFPLPGGDDDDGW